MDLPKGRITYAGHPISGLRATPSHPHERLCKARYAVLFQIRTFPPEPVDEEHIGPPATYDEVIYPGFQHDITTLQIQGYTSHTIGIQLPEFNTSAEYTCLSTDYKQYLMAKVKHTMPTYTRVQALRRGSLASRRRVFTKTSRRRIVELH